MTGWEKLGYAARRTAFVILASLVATSSWAQTQLTAEQRQKVEKTLKQIAEWGSDPTMVKAIKDYEASPPAELNGMTQEKWAGLSVLGPEIKVLTKHPVVEYLRAKCPPYVSELFVSASNGNKVAFFAKTTSWNHKGKSKHDVPLSGKTWIGAPELDESTGKQQVQISFPVLAGKKPIGSVVVGLDFSKL